MLLFCLLLCLLFFSAAAASVFAAVVVLASTVALAAVVTVATAASFVPAVAAAAIFYSLTPFSPPLVPRRDHRAPGRASPLPPLSRGGAGRQDQRSQEEDQAAGVRLKETHHMQYQISYFIIIVIVTFYEGVRVLHDAF